MLSRQAPFALILAFGLATGCSDRILDDDPALAIDAPRVLVTSPARGTIVAERQISVEGRVEEADAPLGEVLVNGERVPVREDGSFRTLIQVGDGITLIRTTATDLEGNEGADTRAVMAGNLVGQDAPVFDGAAGRLGRTTFDNLNVTLENLLVNEEELAQVLPDTPFFEGGGDCLGAKVSLSSVQIGQAEVEILPTEGGITFDVILHDAQLVLRTDYAVACADSGANIYVAADAARVVGSMDIGLDRGTLEVGLRDVQSYFSNASVDVGVIDSSIIELVLIDLDAVAGYAVESLVESQVNRFIDSFLTNFTHGEWVVNLFGADLVFGATPTVVEFDSDGGTIAVDTTVTAMNPVKDLGYIATPAPSPVTEMFADPGFRAVIADDFVNQALAAFWASGALENAVAFDSEVENKKSFLGNAIDRVEVTMMLPPYVDARDDRAMSITIGDLILDVIDEAPTGDQVITRMAISGSVAISVEIDAENRISFRTETPQVWVDILSVTEGVSGPNPLDRDSVEVLVSFVAARLAGATDDLVGQIPVPSIAGTSIAEAALEPDQGYISVSGSLSIQP